MSAGITVYRKSLEKESLSGSTWKDEMVYGPEKMDFFLPRNSWPKASLTFSDGSTVTWEYQVLGTVLLVNLMSKKELVIRALEQAAFLFANSAQYPKFLESTLLLGRIVGLTEQSYTTWSDVPGLDATLRAVWPLFYQNAPQEAGVLRQLLFATLQTPKDIFQQYVPILLEAEPRLCEEEQMKFYDEKLPHCDILDNLRHLSTLISNPKLSEKLDKVDRQQDLALISIWEGNNKNNWAKIWIWKRGPSVRQWVSNRFFENFASAVIASDMNQYGWNATLHLEFYTQQWQEMLSQLEQGNPNERDHQATVELYSTCLRNSGLQNALLGRYGHFTKSAPKSLSSALLPAFDFAYTTVCLLLASMRLQRALAEQLCNSTFLGLVQKMISANVFNSSTVPSIQNNKLCHKQTLFDTELTLEGKQGFKQDSRLYLRLSFLATMDHLLQANILGPNFNPQKPPNLDVLTQEEVPDPFVIRRIDQASSPVSSHFTPPRDLLRLFDSPTDLVDAILPENPAQELQNWACPTPEHPLPCSHHYLFAKPSVLLLDLPLESEKLYQPSQDAENPNPTFSLLDRWAFIHETLIGPVAALLLFAMPSQQLPMAALQLLAIVRQRYPFHDPPTLKHFTEIETSRNSSSNSDDFLQSSEANKFKVANGDKNNEILKTCSSNAPVFQVDTEPTKNLYEWKSFSEERLPHFLRCVASLLVIVSHGTAVETSDLMEPVLTWILAFAESSIRRSVFSPQMTIDISLEASGVKNLLMTVLATPLVLRTHNYKDTIPSYVGHYSMWRLCIPRTIGMLVQASEGSRRPHPAFEQTWNALFKTCMEPLAFLPSLESILEVMTWISFGDDKSEYQSLKLLSNFSALLPRVTPLMLRTDCTLDPVYYKPQATSGEWVNVFSTILAKPKQPNLSQVHFSSLTLAAQILRSFNFRYTRNKELFARILDDAMYWILSNCAALSESCLDLFGEWTAYFSEMPSEFDAFSTIAKTPTFFFSRDFYASLISRPRAAIRWFRIIASMGSLSASHPPSALVFHHQQCALAAYHLSSIFKESLTMDEEKWKSKYFLPSSDETPSESATVASIGAYDLPYVIKEDYVFHQSMRHRAPFDKILKSSFVASYPNPTFDVLVSSSAIRRPPPDGKGEHLKLGTVPHRKFDISESQSLFTPPWDRRIWTKPWTHQQWILECAIQAFEAATICPDTRSSLHDFPKNQTSAFINSKIIARMPIETLITTISNLIVSELSIVDKLGQHDQIMKCLWRILNLASYFFSNLSLELLESLGKLLASILEDEMVLRKQPVLLGGWFSYPNILSKFLLYARSHLTRISWHSCLSQLKKPLIPDVGDPGDNVVESRPLEIYLELTSIFPSHEASSDASSPSTKIIDCSTSATSSATDFTTSGKQSAPPQLPSSTGLFSLSTRKQMSEIIKRYVSESPSTAYGLGSHIPDRIPIVRYMALFGMDPVHSLQVLSEVSKAIFLHPESSDGAIREGLASLFSKIPSSLETKLMIPSPAEEQILKFRDLVLEALKLSLETGVAGSHHLCNPISMAIPALLNVTRREGYAYDYNPLLNCALPHVKALPKLTGGPGLPSVSWLFLMRNPDFFLHILALLEAKEAPPRLGKMLTHNTPAFLDLLPPLSVPSQHVTSGLFPAAPASPSWAATSSTSTSATTPSVGSVLTEDLDLLLAFLSAFLYFHDKERKAQFKSFVGFKDLRKRVKRLLEAHGMGACGDITLPYGLLLSLPPHALFTKKTIDSISVEKPSALDATLPSFISSSKTAALWPNEIWKHLSYSLNYPRSNRPIHAIGTNMLIGCATSQILTVLFSRHAVGPTDDSSAPSQIEHPVWTTTPSGGVTSPDSQRWMSVPYASPLSTASTRRDGDCKLFLFKIHVTPLAPFQHPHVRLGWATESGYDELLRNPHIGVGDVAGTWAFSPIEAKVFYESSFTTTDPLPYKSTMPPVEFASYINIKTRTIGFSATVDGREVLLPSLTFNSSVPVMPCISLYSTRILAVDFPLWS